MSSAVSQGAPSALDPTAAVRLILGVSRLGESDLAGWWSSQGMNPAVQFTLSGFPRTSKVVGAELAYLSAVRRHRQILPRSTAVHLFSPHLPFSRWTRSYLAEQKTSGESAIVDKLRAWDRPDEAREQILAWCEAIPAHDYDAETVRTDTLEDSTIVSRLLVRLAREYAVQKGDFLVPYVDMVT